MKFMIVTLFDVAKGAELAQISDKLSANPPPGTTTLASYFCQGIPFPGIPLNMGVTITIGEAESNEAIAAATWPLRLAGATVWHVPLLEMPVGGIVEWERKFRG